MLVYNPKNVVGPGRSSEKIRHVVNAERSSLVLEDYDGVTENIPEDHPFDIGGESINLKKFIIKAFQRCRPTAVALNALAVGIHVEPWPEAGTAFGEGPGPLLKKLQRCRSGFMPIRHQDCQVTSV